MRVGDNWLREHFYEEAKKGWVDGPRWRLTRELREMEKSTVRIKSGETGQRRGNAEVG